MTVMNSIIIGRLPNGSLSCLVRTFSPMLRIRRSNKGGFCRISECPYQYTSGRRADDESAVGAEVAVNPRGLAGVCVDIGVSTAEAEMVPGTVKHP